MIHNFEIELKPTFKVKNNSTGTICLSLNAINGDTLLMIPMLSGDIYILTKDLALIFDVRVMDIGGSEIKYTLAFGTEVFAVGHFNLKNLTL